MALELSEMRIESIERDYFVSDIFRCLRSLDLRSNRIKKLTSGCFNGLNNLIELNLSNNNLSSRPRFGT